MRKPALSLAAPLLLGLPVGASAQDPNDAAYANCDEAPGGSRTVRTNGFAQGLYVVSSNLPDATFTDDANGLADRNIVCAHWDDRTSGGTVVIPWAQFDRGEGMSGGRYDWSFVEEQIAPWAVRGQLVNLLVWPAVQKESQQFPDGQPATPAYIMNQPGVTFQCPDGSAQGTGSSGELPLPKFWEGRVKTPYREALLALVERYEDDDRINYFRFGIGVGAESYPANGTTTPTNYCRDDFISIFAGDNETQKANKAFNVWLGHAKESVLAFRAFDSAKPIVVTVNDFRTSTAQGLNKFPNDLANQATRNYHGYPLAGLGVQGATTADKDRWNASPRQRCNANWCVLFNSRKTLNIPLQLQTPTHSGVKGRPEESVDCPGSDNVGADGCMKTGNMAELIGFAAARGVNAYELYPYEWQVANDTAQRFYPDHDAEYGAALDSVKN